MSLSSIFGGDDMPVKFSIEHYPPGSPSFWGGTNTRGTIRYGYSSLEDNSPEWNLYGVPHMIGYYTGQHRGPFNWGMSVSPVRMPYDIICVNTILHSNYNERATEIGHGRGRPCHY